MKKAENKRKRQKLQCLKCGSFFDDDYKRRHEIAVHEGKTISVKTVGAPSNPFEAARGKKRTNVLVIILFSIF
jgi:hypothetical protein